MSRADRVAARLAERELDLLLVTDLVNLRYLTGFTGTNGLALVGPDTRRFLTDFRYVERAKAEVRGFDLEPAPQELRAALAAGWPPGELRLGFEDQHVSVRRHAELRETLPDRIELVPAGGLVEAERAVKEPAEVAAIRAAAALADDDLRLAARVGARRADRARGRARARAGDARARRVGPELPLDRRRGRERRAAARRRRATSRSRPARSSRSTSARGWTATARTARAPGRPASCPTTWPSSTSTVLRGAGDRARRGAAGAGGPRDRRDRARHHRRRRPRRALRPRARPRRRDGHPRGAAAGAHGRGAARGRATSSPSSPGIYVPGRGGARIEDLVVVTDGRPRRAQRHVEGAHLRGVVTPSARRRPSRRRARRPITSAMELRARIRPLSRRAAFAAASVALFASAVAGAVAPPPTPPRRARRRSITEGRAAGRRRRRGADDPRPQLHPGRNKNTVVFKRAGARAVFAKARCGHEEDAARSRCRRRCRSSSWSRSGNPVPTRFRLRVLAKQVRQEVHDAASAPRSSPARARRKPVVPDDRGRLRRRQHQNGVDDRRRRRPARGRHREGDRHRSVQARHRRRRRRGRVRVPVGARTSTTTSTRQPEQAARRTRASAVPEPAASRTATSTTTATR